MPYNSDGIFYANNSTSASISDITKEQADTIGSAISIRGFLSEVKIYNNPGFYEFKKSDYPNLSSIRVRCLGGGGGGGRCSTTGSTQVSSGDGGSGGVLAESFLKDISIIPEIISIGVGAGGAGALANEGLNGKIGENSFFGNIVIAEGGNGGASRLVANSVPFPISSSLSPGGFQSKGEIIKLAEAAPLVGYSFTDDINIPAGGGNAMFTSPVNFSSTTTGANGINGSAYPGYYGIGGGAGANCQNQATARSGGNGSGGLVILDIYTYGE
jgi:hypothetical protein